MYMYMYMYVYYVYAFRVHVCIKYPWVGAAEKGDGY